MSALLLPDRAASACRFSAPGAAARRRFRKSPALRPSGTALGRMAAAPDDWSRGRQTESCARRRRGLLPRTPTSASDHARTREGLQEPSPKSRSSIRSSQRTPPAYLHLMSWPAHAATQFELFRKGGFATRLSTQQPTSPLWRGRSAARAPGEGPMRRRTGYIFLSARGKVGPARAITGSLTRNRSRDFGLSTRERSARQRRPRRPRPPRATLPSRRRRHIVRRGGQVRRRASVGTGIGRRLRHARIVVARRMRRAPRRLIMLHVERIVFLARALGLALRLLLLGRRRGRRFLWARHARFLVPQHVEIGFDLVLVLLPGLRDLLVLGRIVRAVEIVAPVADEFSERLSVSVVGFLEFLFGLGVVVIALVFVLRLLQFLAEGNERGEVGRLLAAQRLRLAEGRGVLRGARTVRTFLRLGRLLYRLPQLPGVFSQIVILDTGTAAALVVVVVTLGFVMGTVVAKIVVLGVDVSHHRAHQAAAIR